MEGDRKVTLFEPTKPTKDSYGQPIEGAPIEHIAWAVRRDRGGSEGLQADTQVGEWQTVFRVRRDGLEKIGQSWSVTDDDGTEWDIERVSEVPMPPRRWLRLYCVARAGA